MHFLLSSNTFQAVFMTSPSGCLAVALNFVDPNPVINLPAGHFFSQFLLSSRPYHRPPCWLDPFNGCYLCLLFFLSFFFFPFLLLKQVSSHIALRRSMMQILSKLLSRHLSSCDSIAAIFSSLVPCTVDLACVVFTQEAAERFVFLSCSSDLFNLLLCPFSVPTLSSFQNQSSCLLYTRYTYKGLCPFLNYQVISVFTIYLLSVQITFFFP